MRRSTKIVLVILGIVAVLWLADFLISSGKKKVWEKNSEMYYKLLEECDFEGAKEYAKKLNGDTAAAEVEFLQKFYTLYETGDWQAAIDAFDSDGKSHSHSKMIAFYCDCYYQQLIPAAEEALQKDDLEGAAGLLLQFQQRFHAGGGNGSPFENGSHICNFDDFKKYFPEKASHYFDLVCEVGDKALSTEDESVIALLPGFQEGRYPRTFRPDTFSWAKTFSAYQSEDREKRSALRKERKALRETKYEKENLKNWNAEALEAAFGADDIYTFTPTDPQPLCYIVSAYDVIDPRTDAAAEGGYYSGGVYQHAWNPVSTNDLLSRASLLKDSALTLTDDPDKATYALILDMNYTDRVGSYTYQSGNKIPVYYSTLNAVLLDLTTKKTLQSKTLTSDPYTNVNGRDYIAEDLLEKARGQQLYSPVPSLSISDFPDYWSFIGQADLAPGKDP